MQNVSVSYDYTFSTISHYYSQPFGMLLMSASAGDLTFEELPFLSDQQYFNILEWIHASLKTLLLVMRLSEMFLSLNMQ